MTHDQLLVLIDEQFQQTNQALLRDKHLEYSRAYTPDVLSHFKDMEGLENRPAVLTCKTYLLRQILSLNAQLETWDNLSGAAETGMLFSSKITNRIDDAINYLILMKGLIADARAALPQEGDIDEQNEVTIASESI